MLKYATHIMVVILILIFVGCKEHSVAPESSYLPDTTARSKIDSSGFSYKGMDREYYVFLPKNYQPNMAVVINLHNFKPIKTWMKYTRMNGVADAEGFIVVYPAAITNWEPVSSFTNDVGFISALIDTLEIKYNIDMTKIYCAGGGTRAGNMTYRLIGEIGHRFAAAAPVSAALFDDATNWELSQFTPLLIINGTADPYTSYWGNDRRGQWSVKKTIDYWIKNNNCSLQADTLLLPDIDTTDNSKIEKISWTNCSNNSSIVHYKVINGAHHWPGGLPDHGGLGENKNNDVNSSAEMWNFFKNYSNPLVK